MNLPLELGVEYWVFDEITTRDIYQTFLATIPHTFFTFSKAWLYYAQFEILHKNLTAARKKMGIVLGSCPRDKLFGGIIYLEIQLREFERCHILYKMYLEFGPEKCVTWMDSKRWEEKIDYIFTEDDAVKQNLTLLETAKAWNKIKMEENKNK